MLKSIIDAELSSVFFPFQSDRAREAYCRLRGQYERRRIHTYLWWDYDADVTVSGERVFGLEAELVWYLLPGLVVVWEDLNI